MLWYPKKVFTVTVLQPIIIIETMGELEILNSLKPARYSYFSQTGIRKKINSVYISFEGTSVCKEFSNTVLRYKLKQGFSYT